MKPIHLPSQSKEKKRRMGKMTTILVILLGAIVLALIISIISGKNSVFKYVFPTSTLRQSEDKVNILLLGNAGGKHDGALLTDTIMVASYDLKNQNVYFISIPRDLWVDKIHSKVNAAYEQGFEDNDQGLKRSKEVIGELLGLDINYGIRLDFSGFEQAVDEVDGIEVDVDKSFDDFLYPIAGKEDDLCGFKEEEKDYNEEEAKKLNIPPGKHKFFIAPDGRVATNSADPNFGYENFTCRYEHISFKKGPTQMNGETALKYVRSRMGSNGEGNDFARSRRQQKVIEAFRKKVLSLETLANPARIRGLMLTFGNSFETDIPVDDMIVLYGQSKKINKTFNTALTNSDDGLLINPSPADYGGAWVLVPKDKSYSEIKTFVDKFVKGEINEATSSARPSNR